MYKDVKYEDIDGIDKHWQYHSKERMVSLFLQFGIYDLEVVIREMEKTGTTYLGDCSQYDAELVGSGKSKITPFIPVKAFTKICEESPTDLQFYKNLVKYAYYLKRQFK